MQKYVNLVDLVKSFPTNIYLQNLASIQKITCPIKFDHLAEKSEKGSISNLSTKVGGVGFVAAHQARPALRVRAGAEADGTKSQVGDCRGPLGQMRRGNEIPDLDAVVCGSGQQFLARAFERYCLVLRGKVLCFLTCILTFG